MNNKTNYCDLLTIAGIVILAYLDKKQERI